MKYISYRWNLFRLTMEFKYAFLERMHKELSEAKNKGLFDKKYFTEKEWTDINRLVDDMDAFFDETFRKELLRFGSEAELAKALKKSENKVTKLQKKIDDMEIFIFKNWKSNYLCSAKTEKNVVLIKGE